MKKKIQVKKKHITSGTGSCAGTNTCPIALAVLEQTNFTHVSVQWTHTFLFKNDAEYYKIKNTPAMKKFIDAFDNGHHVKPMSFILDIPLT